MEEELEDEEYGAESCEEEDDEEPMSEDNEVTWDRNVGNEDETIIKNMHQTEAPKKIEEMVRPETTEELHDQEMNSGSSKEEKEPFTVEMDSTEKAFEDEVEQDKINESDLAEQLRPCLSKPDENESERNED